MENTALVLEGPKVLILKEKPVQDCGPDDLLIKVHSVGICGTDLHYYAHGSMGPFTLTEPHVLGHETSGVVFKVGSNVKNFSEGDRVTLEPAIPCNTCEDCKAGKNNLCPVADNQVVGSPPKDGCFQNYFVHPANLCHKLPENLTMEEGALVEPMACVVHAIQRSGITVGQDVLVCGSGPMGLLCMLTAKAFGAKRVVMTDINPIRLSQGKKAGADATYLVNPVSDYIHQSREIQQLFGGPGGHGREPHVTLECTGVESSLKVALNVTRKGGKVALVGLGPVFVSVPLCMASLRQVDIIGCARYNNTFSLAIELISTKQVDAAQVITHRFPLKSATNAFDTVIRGEANKVLIQCNRDVVV